MARRTTSRLLVLVACALLAAPALGDAATDRAWAAFAAGDLARALTESEGAVAAPGAGADAWKVRAYLLSRGGRKEEAAEAYRRVLTLAPSDAVAHNNLGAVLLDLGRLAEARAALEAALRIDPLYADARNNLGAALERAGRVDEAVTEYRTAAGAGRTHAAAMNNLGAIALRRGRADRAAAAFARALSLDGTMAAPMLNLAILGDPSATDGESLARLRAAAERPDAAPAVRARAWAALGASASRANRWDEARAHYLKALALAPEDTAILNNLAVAEDRLGLDRDAILHLEDALAEDPDLLVARNNVGIVHVHRGDAGLAMDVFQDLIRRSPTFHRAHYNLGVVHASQGRLAEAIEAMERAASLAPRDAAVRYDLTLLRAKSGASAAEERAGYEAALSLDPDLIEARLALGGLLADPATPAEIRDETLARRHLERFLGLTRPNDEDGRAQALAWIAWLDERRGT